APLLGGHSHRAYGTHESYGPYEIGHDVCSTIFPNCPASSMRRCAAGASASGTTWSTTGFGPPAAYIASMSANSLARPIVEPRIESCFQKIRRTSTCGTGPVVAP